MTGLECKGYLLFMYKMYHVKEAVTRRLLNICLLISYLLEGIKTDFLENLSYTIILSSYEDG